MFDRVKGIISLFVIVLMVTMFTACSGGPKVQTSEAPTVSESQKETEESTTETEAQAVPEESVPEAEEPAEETSVEAESETETERPVQTLQNSIVNVSMTMTFYETAYNAPSLDGLIIETPKAAAEAPAEG